MAHISRLVVGACLLIAPLLLVTPAATAGDDGGHPYVDCYQAVRSSGVDAYCDVNGQDYGIYGCYLQGPECPGTSFVACKEHVIGHGGETVECQAIDCYGLAAYLDISWHGHDLVEEFVCDNLQKH